MTNHVAQNALEAPTQMAQSLEMVHEFGAGEMPEEDNEGFATAQTGTYFVLIKLLSEIYLISLCKISHIDKMLTTHLYTYFSWFV